MAGERFELEKSSVSLANVDVPVPANRYPQPPDHYNVEETRVDLRELLRIIRQRKWLVISIVIIVTTIVAIQMYRAKSIYQASAVIEVGKDSPTLVKAGEVVYQNDDMDPYYNINIKTKMLMLTSRSFLEEVAASLKLDQNPKFLDLGPGNRKTEGIESASSGGGGNAIQTQPKPDQPEVPQIPGEADEMRSPEERARLAPFVGMLEGGMSVQQVRETRALKISFTHTDPKVAAAVANGIAQTFRQKNYTNKTQRFDQAERWLDKSTRELKAKVEQAEQRLAEYTRNNNIFSTEGKSTLTADKLAHLHDQATRAETDRLLKESLYQEVKKGRVAQLPEVFADVSKSTPKVATLQKELDTLTVTAAQLSVNYGPEHPRVIEVQKQIAALQEQIEGGRKMLEEKLNVDYERAVRDEQALKSALDRAKSEAVHENQAAIQYNILKQDVDTSKSLYTDFLQKHNQAKVQAAEQYSTIRMLDYAMVPGAPAGPKRLQIILVAFILSLGAGIGLAFLLHQLDNTVKGIDDVNRYAQLPTLAVIPAVNSNIPFLSFENGNGIRKLLGHNGSGAHAERKADRGSSGTRALTMAAEAYRGLRTSVLLSTAGGPPKTILVTSSQAGEGKTTTTINTAISLGNLGAKVLIIDADLRRPRVHKALGLSRGRGLTTYLSSDVEIDDLIQTKEFPNLSVLTCGPIPPNPAELVSSEKMRLLLHTLASRYDHIVIDSPPLMNVTDPVILSTLVDGVIMVVHGGKCTREVLRRGRQELSVVGAKVLGVVLNNVNLRRDGYDYYYYYRYYSSYEQDKAESHT